MTTRIVRSGRNWRVASLAIVVACAPSEPAAYLDTADDDRGVSDSAPTSSGKTYLQVDGNLPDRVLSPSVSTSGRANYIVLADVDSSGNADVIAAGQRGGTRYWGFSEVANALTVPSSNALPAPNVVWGNATGAIGVPRPGGYARLVAYGGNQFGAMFVADLSALEFSGGTVLSYPQSWSDSGMPPKAAYPAFRTASSTVTAPMGAPTTYSPLATSNLVLDANTPLAYLNDGAVVVLGGQPNSTSGGVARTDGTWFTGVADSTVRDVWGVQPAPATASGGARALVAYRDSSNVQKLAVAASGTALSGLHSGISDWSTELSYVSSLSPADFTSTARDNFLAGPRNPDAYSSLRYHRTGTPAVAIGVCSASGAPQRECVALVAPSGAVEDRVLVKDIDTGELVGFPVAIPTAGRILGLTAGNIDGTSGNELILAYHQDATVFVAAYAMNSVGALHGTGRPVVRWALPAAHFAPTDITAITAGDVTGDGRAEIFVGEHSSSKIAVLLGGGIDASRGEPWSLNSPSGPALTTSASIPLSWPSDAGLGFSDYQMYIGANGISGSSCATLAAGGAASAVTIPVGAGTPYVLTSATLGANYAAASVQIRLCPRVAGAYSVMYPGAYATVALDPDGDGRYGWSSGVFQDNCPTVSNADQADSDGNGTGDACESDLDHDGDPDATDCDDRNSNIHSGAPEVSDDGVDQDCDGKESCYTDADSDGYRPVIGAFILSNDLDCTDAGEGASGEPATDCNDGASSVHVGAADPTGDGVDQNCDGFDGCGVSAGSCAGDDGDGIFGEKDLCPDGESGWTSSPATDADGDGCRDATEDWDDNSDGIADGVGEAAVSAFACRLSPSDPWSAVYLRGSGTVGSGRWLRIYEGDSDAGDWSALPAPAFVSLPPNAQYAALACGDVDPDSTTEIVLAGPSGLFAWDPVENAESTLPVSPAGAFEGVALVPNASGSRDDLLLLGAAGCWKRYVWNATSYAASGACWFPSGGPQQVFAAELGDGDDAPELFVLESGSVRAYHVAVGVDGVWTLTSGASWPLGCSSTVRNLQLFDLDGDGKTDAHAVCESAGGGYELSTLYGDGEGGFAEACVDVGTTGCGSEASGGGPKSGADPDAASGTEGYAAFSGSTEEAPPTCTPQVALDFNDDGLLDYAAILESASALAGYERMGIRGEPSK